ncbi:MAG: diguanylate cyclase, partial [Gammaproteobacteria bacterium]
MTFGSQQDYDNRWKEKYFQLVEEYRAKHKQALANEELLCKTVIRLTLAAKGFNKELDPYLDRIRQSVKSSLLNT